MGDGAARHHGADRERHLGRAAGRADRRHAPGRSPPAELRFSIALDDSRPRRSPSPAQQTTREATMQPVGVGPRFVAIFIDSIILGIVGYLVALPFGSATSSGLQPPGRPWIPVLPRGHRLLHRPGSPEGRDGRARWRWGCASCKLADGAAISWKDSIIRNVLRIIDGLLLLPRGRDRHLGLEEQAAPGRHGRRDHGRAKRRTLHDAVRGLSGIAAALAAGGRAGAGPPRLDAIGGLRREGRQRTRPLSARLTPQALPQRTELHRIPRRA